MAVASFSIITVGGLVSIPPTFHKTRRDEEYCKFSIAVDVVNANKILNNFYIIKVFDSRMVQLVKTMELIRGSYLLVSGAFELQYANGNAYPTIKPYEIKLIRDKRIAFNDTVADPLQQEQKVYVGNGEGFIEDNIETIKNEMDDDYSIFGIGDE